jgi:lactate dehydrogenase-like 2-hydroxyacid dehydrogenase
MRVVAYNIKSSEKEPLAIANHKKHEITVISNLLTAETASFAAGKQAVIVSSEDLVNKEVLALLANLGVKFIATRAVTSTNIDVEECGRRGIKVASVPAYLISLVNEQDADIVVAHQTILNLDKWEGKACLGSSCVCSKSCDKMAIGLEKPQPLISKNEI